MAVLTFIGGIVLLILGYIFYGSYIERNFQINPDRLTPAEVLQDGMDFVPMPRWKNCIIELLNIAGTGPIFGPIMGALYGPAAYIWIVLGCIFAGAVHDYMIGMISLRNNGAHLPELAAKYLGKPVRHLVNIFIMLLLLLVGTVFVISPATLIADISPDFIGIGLTTFLIFVYYIISTFLPIDQAMGKVYPWFAGILILSTVAMGIALLTGGYQLPDLNVAHLTNIHPNHTPIFPALFFTVSCGAISGFHATQTPMVSRTMTKEREGRITFYGMMIAEGIIAMIWAAASMTLFEGRSLAEMIQTGTPSYVVNQVSVLLLGNVLGTAAILGVIVLPISSGLSAFRSLRNILAEYIGFKQDTARRVLTLTLPIFAVAFVLTMMDFNIIWRYFNWANQVTAVISLFVSTRYLFLHQRNYWVTFLPAVLMLYACVAYILSQPIGFNLGLGFLTHGFSILISTTITLLFIKSGRVQKNRLDPGHALLNDHLPIQTLAR